MPLKSCRASFLCEYHERVTLQRLPPFGECDLDPDSENRYSCYFLSEIFLLQMKKIKMLTGNPEQNSRVSFQLWLKTQRRKAACSFSCSSLLVLPQEAAQWRPSRGCFVIEVKTLWIKVSTRILEKYCSQKHSTFILVFGSHEHGRQKRVAPESWPQSGE